MLDDDKKLSVAMIKFEYQNENLILWGACCAAGNTVMCDSIPSELLSLNSKRMTFPEMVYNWWFKMSGFNKHCTCNYWPGAHFRSLYHDRCATKEKYVIEIIQHLWLMSQHDLMTRLSYYSSFLTTVHSANSNQEQPVISCLKSSSNLSKSAITTLPCGGQLTMLSARINYLHP